MLLCGGIHPLPSTSQVVIQFTYDMAQQQPRGGVMPAWSAGFIVLDQSRFCVLPGTVQAQGW